MDYQCIVVYTIVRINPLYQISIENFHKERRRGCFYWIKNQIKRFDTIQCEYEWFFSFLFIFTTPNRYPHWTWRVHAGRIIMFTPIAIVKHFTLRHMNMIRLSPICKLFPLTDWVLQRTAYATIDRWVWILNDVLRCFACEVYSR